MMSSELSRTLIEGAVFSIAANFVIHCQGSSPLSTSFPFPVNLAPKILSRLMRATATSIISPSCASSGISPGEVAEGIHPIRDDPVPSPCRGLPIESAPVDILRGRCEWLEPGIRLLDPARDGVVGNGIMLGKTSSRSRSGVSRDGRRVGCCRTLRVDEDAEADSWLTEREEFELNP